jgi:DNA-directed RNA polymerase
MERYKDYKVPISSVKGGTLNKLTAMEQITLTDIINSSTMIDDVSEQSGEVALSTSEDLLAALDKAIGLTESDDKSVEVGGATIVASEAEDAPSEAQEAEGSTNKSSKRRSRGTKGDAYLYARRTEVESPEEAKVQNSFIDLTKLLPPLPKKGNFEVSTIKKSLYFFS